MIEWNGQRGITLSGRTVVVIAGGWREPIYRVNFYQPGSKSHLPNRSFDVEEGNREDWQEDAENLAKRLAI